MRKEDTLTIAVVVVLVGVAGLHAGQLPPRDRRPPASPRFDAVIPMGRAIVRGRVLAADTGRPLARATVSATATINGQRRSESIGTDGDGGYEFVGLPAGRYTISARRDGYIDQFVQRLLGQQATVLEIEDDAVVDVDLRLVRSSVIRGRVTDELGQPLASAFVRAIDAQDVRNIRAMGRGPILTDGDGVFRITGLMPGSYLISGESSEQWAGADGEGQVAYARTYFPGGTSVLNATPVTVGAGEEGDVTFSLVAGRLATISGTAFDSKGTPLQGLMLLNEDLSPVRGVAVVLSRDGMFHAENVRPGRYTLRGAAPAELASIPLEVDGADLDGVSVRSTPGWSVSGGVVVDSSARASLDFRRLAVAMTVEAPPQNGALLTPEELSRAVTAGFGPRPGSGALASAEVGQDGRFQATALSASRITVRTPPGWFVASMTADGRDVMGHIVDLPSGAEFRNVEITVTDRAAAVSGRVVDGAGGPVPFGTVIVFSEDATRWFPGTGAVRENRLDHQGAFTLAGLPPGRYAIAAFGSLERGVSLDPAHLDSLLPHAYRFSVAADEHHEGVTVRLTR